MMDHLASLARLHARRVQGGVLLSVFLAHCLTCTKPPPEHAFPAAIPINSLLQ